MSGTLKKSPSEGDISSTYADNRTDESSSKSKEILQKPNYHPPDFKKGFLANSGFRLVWKTSNNGGLTNLNKVLDLHYEVKRPRSTSPRLPQSVQVDNVFSEHFDPLAVHKRGTTDSGNIENLEELRGIPRTENKNNNPERKRTGPDTENLDMPSVKLLKELFEASEKENVAVRKADIFKRSNTISDYRIRSPIVESLNILRNRNLNTSTVDDLNKIAGEISISTVSTEKSYLDKENIDYGKDTNELGSTLIENSSFAANIESEHIPKVKDLLLIYQKLGKAKSVPADLDQISNNTSSRIHPNVNKVCYTGLNDNFETFAKFSNLEMSQINKDANKSEEFTDITENKLYRENYNEVPAPTLVFNLRQKWESLTLKNSAKEKKGEEKTDSIKSKTFKQSFKKQSTEIIDIMPLKPNTSIPQELDSTTISFGIERKFEPRSSVKDIAHNFETNKVKKFKSAPTTLSATRNTLLTDIITPVKPSILSGEQQDQSLEKIEIIKSFIPETSNNKEISMNLKPAIDITTSFQSQIEFSLGNLQRQTSVTKLKGKDDSKFSNSSPFSVNNTEIEGPLTSAQRIFKSSISFEKQKEMSIESLKRQAIVTETNNEMKNTTHNSNAQYILAERNSKHANSFSASGASESKIEMSLGSLERQASVTKYKEKYELQTQKSTQNTDTEITLKQAVDVSSSEALEPKLFHENTKEMSLESLKRQASVSKMKEKYHSQIQSQGFKTEQTAKQFTTDLSPSAPESKIGSENMEISSGTLKRQASVTKMKEEYNSKLQKHSSSKSMTTTNTVNTMNQVNSISSVEILNTKTKINSQYIDEKDLKINTTTENRVAKENTRLHGSKLHTPSENNGIEKNEKKIEKSKKKSKIEELVESFMKSEGLSSNPEVSNNETSNLQNATQPRGKDIYSDNFDIQKAYSTSFTEETELKNQTNSSSVLKKSLSSSSTLIRTGSRDLKPDELKYFQNLPSAQDSCNKTPQKRERSSSFDSSSTTSKLPKEELVRSKLRSSSRQYRDLHKDELKFFDSKINGTMSKISFRNSSELALRQEVLGKTVRSSYFENGETEE